MAKAKDSLLSVQEVALRYHVSTRTIAAWWSRGLMPAPSRLGNRLLRWRLAELLVWEDSQRETIEQPKEVANV